MSGLIEVSWIVLAASAFILLPYHTSCGPWKLCGTLLRVWEWKRPKNCVCVIVKITLTLQTNWKGHKDPQRSLDHTLGTTAVTEEKHRQKRVLNLGWWSWFSLPWEMGRRKQGVKTLSFYFLEQSWGPSLESEWTDQVCFSGGDTIGLFPCWDLISPCVPNKGTLWFPSETRHALL